MLSCRFFDQYTFFATFVRSSARDFSFCIHGHAGWCHWKRILWGQNLYEVAFIQPIPRLLLILSTKLQLPLTLFQLVKDRATMLYPLPFFRDVDAFTSAGNKLERYQHCTNFRKGWAVSCKILFLGLSKIRKQRI